MPDFDETLTIRIEGESSSFLGELDRVVARVEDLESRLAAFEAFEGTFARLFERIGQLTQPLERVQQAVTRVSQSLQQLSHQPVTLNVQPALGALQQLQAQIAAVAASLAALNGFGAMGFASPGGMVGVPGFAQGGMVHGRPGLDRIPALLTAGEFVIREPVVQDVGVPFLQALNEFGRANTGPRASAMAETDPPPAPAATTHYGGIHIAVQQTTDLRDVLRELSAGETRLRQRRG